MKKLMIAAAIVCAAVVSQAATASWGVGASNIFAGKNDTTKVAKSATVYMFDAGKTTQAALFEVFAADVAKFDATKATGYAATVETSAAGVMSSGSVTFDYGNQTTDPEHPNAYSFFFAIVQDDAIYLSATKGGDAGGTSTPVSLAWGNQNDGTATFSKSLPTEGFVAAGHWAQAVPEPTSGLLLLLGVAGLALKRRRA